MAMPEAFEASEVIELLLKWDMLTRRQRSVFFRRIHGESIRQIARQLRIPQTTVARDCKTIKAVLPSFQMWIVNT
jgi:FixJ family two-component response regulator